MRTAYATDDENRLYNKEYWHPNACTLCCSINRTRRREEKRAHADKCNNCTRRQRKEALTGTIRSIVPPSSPPLNTLLFPRLARAASACPGLAGEPVGVTDVSPAPHWPREDDMSLKAPQVMPPAGSDEAFAHAIDTDNIATPASAVLDD